jgi:EAL domain-containing protein (putative c-di-GMP-specific phosphodiesterase class I)
MDDGAHSGLDRLLRDVIEGRAIAAMALQPIVDIMSRREFAHEAFLRLPGHAQVSPADLWRLAEASGVVDDLEDVVVRLCTALPVRPNLTRLFVNVSPLASRTAERWRQVPRVVIELPADGPLPDGLVESLRHNRLPYALDLRTDDLATLRDLLTMRPDYVKLSRVVAADAHRDPARAAHLGLLCAYAREAGATVIAEGVEQAAEAATLMRCGVQYAQGYWLGRPSHRPA